MTPDTPPPTVTLAEFAHGAPREAAPLTPVPAVAPAAIHTVEEAAAALSAQYRYAVDGLYEAYRFGLILLVVKRYLEWKGEGEGAARPLDPAEAQGASPRPAPVGAGFVDAEMGDGHDAGTVGLPGESARGLARCEQPHGGALAAPGWNRGMGLKAWLARYCPEINYSTAKRFLAVAERTHAALAAASETGRTDLYRLRVTANQSVWRVGERVSSVRGEANRQLRASIPAYVPVERVAAAGEPFEVDLALNNAAQRNPDGFRLSVRGAGEPVFEESVLGDNGSRLILVAGSPAETAMRAVGERLLALEQALYEDRNRRRSDPDAKARYAANDKARRAAGKALSVYAKARRGRILAELPGLPRIPDPVR